MKCSEPVGPPNCLPAGWNEQHRLAALEHYYILDTEREKGFDDLVDLASALFQAPIAIINFVGSDRQWFKAEVGVGCSELPLDDSICRFAILQPGVFVVADLTADTRFDTNSLVHVVDGLRFYAGALLETDDGLPLGTICVLDREPRPEGITDWQRRGLKALAAQVMAKLDAHVALRNFRFLAALNDNFQKGLAPEALIQATVTALGEHLDFAQCGFAEVDTAQEYIQVDHEFCDGRVPSFAGRWLMRDFGAPFIDDLLAGNTIVIPDVAADRRTNAAESLVAYADIHTQAILNVPLVRDGKVMAVLFNHHPTLRHWTNADIALVEEVCRRLWNTAERSRASEMARERAMELEALISSAPIGIAYFDRNHRYLRINDELAGTNGANVAAHFGHTIEQMAPELAAIVTPQIDQVFATGTALRDVEVSGSTPGAPDKVCHWLVSYFPVFGAGDVVGSVGAFVVDITARKQIEGELAAKAAWLREAQDLGGIGSWTYDYEQRRGRVSPTYLQLHGFDDDELTIGDTRLFEVMHPDDHEPYRKVVKHSLETRGRTMFDYRVTADDGSIRWVRSIGSMIDAEDGTPTLRSSGIVQDVTRERQTFEDLTKANEALTAASVQGHEKAAEIESIYVNAPIGLCVIDADLRFVRVNERLAKINGVTVADHIGRHVQDVVPDIADQIMVIMKSVLAGGTVHNVAIAGTTSAQPGMTHSWRANYSPLLGKEGTIIGVTVSVEEITDEKRRQDELERARDALHQLNSKLEARVVERTVDLQRANADLMEEHERRAELHAQLVQSQKLDALGQMTSGFAHDFNNTIQAISAGFSMIDKWTDDPRIKNVSAMSLEAARRGSSLIKQMLAFARQQRLELRSLDLCTLLETLKPMLQRAAPDATIIVDCPAEIPHVATDPTLFEAALINFTVNARDAMPDGRGTITLKVTVRSADDADHPSELAGADAIAIMFIDNGSGIPPDVLARVMEPFFTTKELGKGTGLGLASASGFAHQSGGAMRVSSVEGEGTTITLYLPIAEGTASIDEASHSAFTDNDKMLRILLVDDDPIVRTMTAIQLHDLGYDVIEAASASEALTYADDLAQFAGVVSDVTMPECDGPSLIRQLRGRQPDLNVVFITGNARIGELDGEYVLDKPFTEEALGVAVARFIPRHLV